MLRRGESDGGRDSLVLELSDFIYPYSLPPHNRRWFFEANPGHHVILLLYQSVSLENNSFLKHN